MVRLPYRDIAPAYQDLNQVLLHVGHRRADAGAPRPGWHGHPAVRHQSRAFAAGARTYPTAAEAGYRELTFEGTVGLYGWRDMPATSGPGSLPCLRVSSPARPRARALAVGTALRGGTPAEFAAAIAQQRGKIATIHQATQKKPAQDRCASPGVDQRSASPFRLRGPSRTNRSSRHSPLSSRCSQSPSPCNTGAGAELAATAGEIHRAVRPRRRGDISARLLADRLTAHGVSRRGGEPAGRRRSWWRSRRS